MKKGIKAVRKAVSLLVVLALLVPLAGEVTVMPASAATQAEIDGLKDQAADLNSQRAQLQQQLKAIQADKSKALEQKSLLEQQINATQAEINNIQTQIQKYSELITQKETELAQAEEQEQELYERFCERVRYMEEEGEVSYWSILFSSSSFSELLDNFMMVEEIVDYDNSVMEELLALQAQIEADKADLESSKAEQEAAKAKQVAAQEDLKNQEAQVDALIQEINSQEELLKGAEADLRTAADAVNEEIKRLEQEMASEIDSVASESDFLWPLPSSRNTLSSLYGSRKDPFTGRPGNHTGIDVPAPKNTAIYASRSGVVTTSVYGSGSSWSYGNYVVISHSDGTSTLYAHMNSRAVSKGEKVSQGQVIGYVGTTGRSTGYHLHFEVRLNGSRRDPVNYFPNKTLYYRSGGKTVQISP